VSVLVAEPERPSLRFDAPGAGSSLEDVVVRAWSGVRLGRAVPCLVCGGELVPRLGAGAAPVGGRCTSCRSELA
jgi:hypothetical protein